MISCTTYNRNTFQKIDILDIKGGDIMDTLKKLQYITDDIRKSYDIPHLYSRVEALHAAEIKKIIKQLDLIKSDIDLASKLRGSSISMDNLRNYIVSLMDDTQDLYVNVLNEKDDLIKKYNSYIVKTLEYLAI